MRGNYFYKRLGDNLRKHRLDKGLSQEQLALLAGVDRSYLAEVESGKANPSIKFLHRLVKILKISLKNLFDNL